MQCRVWKVRVSAGPSGPLAGGLVWPDYVLKLVGDHLFKENHVGTRQALTDSALCKTHKKDSGDVPASPMSKQGSRAFSIQERK